MHIGAKIRLVRKRAKITQRQLAQRSGIPCGMICSYERGRHEPSYFTVECLLKAMGCRLEIVEDIKDE